ncbi:hypothetical protein DBR06_SOUSAS11110037, partial [Sousa chinensis]
MSSGSLTGGRRAAASTRASGRAPWPCVRVWGPRPEDRTHSLLETGAASQPEVKSQSGLQASEGWPARDHRVGARASACSELLLASAVCPWVPHSSRQALSTEEWDLHSRVLKRAAVAAVPQPKK